MGNIVLNKFSKHIKCEQALYLMQKELHEALEALDSGSKDACLKELSELYHMIEAYMEDHMTTPKEMYVKHVQS